MQVNLEPQKIRAITPLALAVAAFLAVLLLSLPLAAQQTGPLPPPPAYSAPTPTPAPQPGYTPAPAPRLARRPPSRRFRQTRLRSLPIKLFRNSPRANSTLRKSGTTTPTRKLWSSKRSTTTLASPTANIG